MLCSNIYGGEKTKIYQTVFNAIFENQFTMFLTMKNFVEAHDKKCSTLVLLNS